MSILIEVNTATMERNEAHALAAFLDALHPGRTNNVLTITGAGLQEPADVAPKPVLLDPMAAAEALMQHESTRVANLPHNAPAADGEPWPRKNSNGIEIDSEGLPWDKRIHSDSKSVVKGGSWKLRRQTDPQLVAQVKAELTATMGAPAAIPMATGGIPAFQPNIPVFTGQPAAQPQPQPPVAQEGVPTFQTLMARVVDLTMAGVPNEHIQAACAPFGLNHPREFNLRPDLIPGLMANLAQLGA